MASVSVKTPDSSQYAVPLWIAGEEIHTGTSFDVVNPVTSKVTWVSCGAKKAEATRAVEAAQAAFPTWSRTKPHQRRDVITRAADILDKRAEEVGGYLRDETGAGNFWLNFNVTLSSEMLRDVAGRITSIAGVIPTCAQEGMHALVYKEPYGVILGIAPW
jgi:acyl-CoA reductase-like NAD-dependent aldehyde dehydrogenase